MINHKQFLVMCDRYGETQMTEIMKMGVRTLKDWKMRGFPFHVKAYVRIACKWEQMKDVLDPLQLTETSPYFTDGLKEREQRSICLEAESYKFRAKRKRDDSFFRKQRRDKRKVMGKAELRRRYAPPSEED